MSTMKALDSCDQSFETTTSITRIIAKYSK